MAQIQKKFIASNAVDGTKIQLANAQSLVALNSSASPVNLLQLDGSNNLLIQQTVDMNTLAITNMANPSAAQDAATKSYVDTLAQGVSWKQIVVSATTSALPTYTYTSGVITASSNGALPAQDGVTLANGDRVLVKNETSGNAPYNGIYVVTDAGSVSTPFILTRSADASTAAELQSATVAIGEGASTQAGEIWFENLPITTLGTDPVGFIAISAGISYTFGNGLQVVGTTVSVLNSDSSITVAAGGISVALNTNGGLATSSGLEVLAANTAIDVSSSGVGVALNTASGLAISSGLKVAAADTSIDVASGGISVALNTNGGLATSSGLEILASDASITVASGGISVYKDVAGALSVSASGLAVNVDGTTVKIATDALQASTMASQNITLSGTDITNQYVDLAAAISATGSVALTVIGGVMQQNGTDYTVSATGGAGGVGRITFAGDLATGGAAALVASDILVVQYEHF